MTTLITAAPLFDLDGVFNLRAMTKYARGDEYSIILARAVLKQHHCNVDNLTGLEKGKPGVT
jgi:hypothetical protein